jgi:pilus assembly protein CpaE
VQLIARPPTLAEAHQIEEHSIRSLIQLSARTYPYVVLDLPRKLDSISGAAIETCDKLLIVIQLNVPSIDNARRLITALTSEGVPQDRLEVVVNRYRKSVHGFTIEMAEKELAQKMFGLVPSDFPSVNKALDTGKPLAPKNIVRAAIAEIASKLARPVAEPQSKSWFTSLVRGK